MRKADSDDYAMVQRRQREAGSYTSPWLVASILLPLVLSVGIFGIGWVLGIVCTDTAGNRGLSEPPCSRIGLGIKLGLGLEAATWLVANVLVWRSGRATVATRLIAALSVAVFVVAVAIESSY